MDPVATARDLLAQGPLYDPCLGRPVADRSHGLTNAERGRALRVALAIADDRAFEAAAPAECWVCEGESARVDAWATWAANELADVEFETYQVGTRVPPLVEENDRLLRETAGLDPEAGEPFKRDLNREVGKRLGDRLGGEVDFGRPDVLVILDVEADFVEVTINAAFVYGRYRKVERGIPQTEWPCRECGGRGTVGGEPCGHCDGVGRLYETSVEGLVAPVIREAMEGVDATFHGAGREDVDARMLGDGRPFVVEVHRPQDRFPDVSALTDAVNECAAGRVEVRDLALATHDMVERVKELPADKTYRAEVAFEGVIDGAAFEGALATLDGATIHQETPTRVAHRRADLERTRDVHHVEGELDDDGRGASVEIRGEGGLYIKELLHGDGGRTEPSLAGLLGAGVDVVALDVLAVEAVEGAFDDPAFLRDPPRP